jgi:hypothetical protein
MIDEEGEMATVDVNAKFVNGKPDAIECKCVRVSAECSAVLDCRQMHVLHRAHFPLSMPRSTRCPSIV